MCDLYNGQPCPECEQYENEEISFEDDDFDCPHDATCTCDEIYEAKRDYEMEIESE